MQTQRCTCARRDRKGMKDVILNRAPLDIQLRAEKVNFQKSCGLTPTHTGRVSLLPLKAKAHDCCALSLQLDRQAMT